MSTAPDPVRVARSRLANASRQDRGSTPETLATARRALTEAKLERAVREALAAAPPLTAAQRDRIAALLRPSAGGGDQVA